MKIEPITMESCDPLTNLGLNAEARIGTSYRLDRRIGRGGAGEVWRAFCDRLQRYVAIKAIHAAHLGEDALREAQVTARLQHPAVVRIYEVIEETINGQHLVFIVLELLDGECLAERIERMGPLDAQLAVEIMLPVLDALDHIHAEGVLHCDIKPGNLMWLRRAPYGPRLRLLDFGIALTAADWRNTNHIQGTPAYMAPEQINGGTLLHTVDQWGAAATLFHLITGKVPFEGSDDRETFEKTLIAPLPFPRDRPMPGSLFRLLARATRKDPAERFRSMGEFRDALKAFVRKVERTPEQDPHNSATFRLQSSQGSRPEREPLPSPLDEAIRLFIDTETSTAKAEDPS